MGAYISACFDMKQQEQASWTTYHKQTNHMIEYTWLC